jgi:hypothetical protein
MGDVQNSMNKISDTIHLYILALYFIMILESTNTTEHNFKLIVAKLIDTRLALWKSSLPYLKISHWIISRT